MATLKICDWFKTKIEKNAPIFVVVVGEQEFEVSEKGMGVILSQLEGEDAPEVGEVIEKIIYREPPPPTLAPATPGIDIEVPGDPFQPGPGSMPQPVRGNADDVSSPNTAVVDDGVPRLEIPDNPKKKFKMPTPAQADKVIAESTVFPEGGLPALTMGGEEQKAAMRMLREIEAQKEKDLQRSARGGINVSTDIRNKPGFYE